MGVRYTKAQSKKALKSAALKVMKVGLSGHITLNAAVKVADSIHTLMKRVK